jgi:pilus assembly protein TadC
MTASFACVLAVGAALASAVTCRPIPQLTPGQQQLLRVAALAALVTCWLLAVLGLDPFACLLAGAVAAVFGAARAGRAERRTAGRDRIAIERALPDALDLLAGLVEAGAPLAAALSAVASRVEGSLRGELGACADALSSAGSRRAAFGLLRQSGSADLARVGQALALADELGTGVAEQLRGQALVQRDLRRSRAREQAGAAAPKIALVIGLLLVPAALSLVLGAELLSALEAAGGS